MRRLGVAAAMFFIAAGPAVPASADDLAERRTLAAELMAIAPVSDAEAAAGFEDRVSAVLKSRYRDAQTPYADQEARLAARAAWSQQPPFNATIGEALAKGLNPGELRYVIERTRDPLAVKLRTVEARLSAAPDDKAREAIIRETLSEAELEQLAGYLKDPVFVKYMTLLKTTAEGLGEAAGADLLPALQARCPRRTAPLPWCN